jgi:hypothetical protein
VETARALGNLSSHADARRCMASLRLDEILATWRPVLIPFLGDFDEPSSYEYYEYYEWIL